jgi:hypothetical protein
MPPPEQATSWWKAGLKPSQWRKTAAWLQIALYFDFTAKAMAFERAK